MEQRWHEFFADTLLGMGFYPCKADPDVWMKDCGTHYEYVCVYVDDLACVMIDPGLFFQELRNWGYKLKAPTPLAIWFPGYLPP